MNPQMAPRRLYRSADDRIFAGVAGGMAAYFDVDPVIVRIIWFLSIFLTGSLTFWVYLIMIAVVPPEPTEWPNQSGWTPNQRPFGYEASYAPPVAGTGPAAGTAGAPPTTDASAGMPGGSATTDPNAAPGMPPAPAPGTWWNNDWRWQRRQERWQRRAERWQQRAERREYGDRGGAGLVFGLFLILGGGMLAWHQIDPGFDLGLTWPVLVIAIGAILVISSIRRAER